MVQPASTPESRPATYQDIIDAEDNLVAEIIDGELHTHPRPAPRHAVASSGVGANISPPFNYGNGGPGGWWILDEPEIHLGDDVVVPDLAGWCRETMPKLPDTAFFLIAPDWVCEVLSTSTRQIDLGSKRDIYAREGVGYLWFVDPDVKTLEAFEMKDGRWSLIATLTEAAAVSVPPFDAISFPLSNLWP